MGYTAVELFVLNDVVRNRLIASAVLCHVCERRTRQPRTSLIVPARTQVDVARRTRETVSRKACIINARLVARPPGY